MPPGRKHGIVDAIYPTKKGMDFNDVWCTGGKEAVLKQLCKEVANVAV